MLRLLLQTDNRPPNTICKEQFLYELESACLYSAHKTGRRLFCCLQRDAGPRIDRLSKHFNAAQLGSNFGEGKKVVILGRRCGVVGSPRNRTNRSADARLGGRGGLSCRDLIDVL